MKTTIDIADALLRQAKRFAARRGTTVKAVVEDALRDALAREAQAERSVELKTHTVDGRGLQPGLSWDDFASLRALAYEGRGA